MKLRDASDAALMRYERLLDRAIERERDALDAFYDDPYTRHYGVGPELSEVVYARGRVLENAAEMLYWELIRRGLREELN